MGKSPGKVRDMGKSPGKVRDMGKSPGFGGTKTLPCTQKKGEYWYPPPPGYLSRGFTRTSGILTVWFRPMRNERKLK